MAAALVGLLQGLVPFPSTQPAQARMKGAAELDAEFYLKNILRGTDAIRDEQVLPDSRGYWTEGTPPPDSMVMDAISASALLTLVACAGLDATRADLEVGRRQAAAKPSTLGIVPGSRSYTYAARLTAIYTYAADVLSTASDRLRYLQALGDTIALHLCGAAEEPAEQAIRKPPGVRRAETALAALRRARLVRSWAWLDEGSLAAMHPEDWDQLSDSAVAGETWAVALEVTGACTTAAASRLSSALPKELLPDPSVAILYSCVARGALPRTRVVFDVLFIEAYRESTALQPNALSLLLRISVP